MEPLDGQEETKVQPAPEHDPFLYNEELRRCTATSDNPLRWEDLPYTLVTDIFEILGFPYRVIKRRVCYSWNELLQEAPPLLFVYKIPLVNQDFQYAKLFHPHEEDSPFRSVAFGTRHLYFNFARDDKTFKFDRRIFQNFIDFAHDQRIGHVIVKNPECRIRQVTIRKARSFDPQYKTALRALGFNIVERPVVFSLVDCDVMFSSYNSGDIMRIAERHHTLFQALPWRRSLIGRLPRLDFERVLSDDPNVFLRPFEEARTKLIWPYPTEQLYWLLHCLENLTDQMTAELYPHVERLRTRLTTFLERDAFDINRHNDFLQFTIVAAYLTHKDDPGFPPAPHKIPICRSHPTTVICECLMRTTDLYSHMLNVM
ncbi:hypothetical protein RvY_08590-2 [Ramazzottius varieornatus]|uniref:F-box domain-containing protein n=1 Tax=Ramazzottius varieornatus TaxID=947166 RepID=A0A1D1VEF4_RAMVA|nr:hypothetical protein RvY_08590-2 [Ramazzottius varieornatus]